MSEDDRCVGGSDHSGPPWEFKLQLYEKSDEARNDRKAGFTGETMVDEGISWQEGDEIDVLNDILYDLRGVKSNWELGWIDYIRPIAEKDDTEDTDNEQ